MSKVRYQVETVCPDATELKEDRDDKGVYKYINKKFRD